MNINKSTIVVQRILETIIAMAFLCFLILIVYKAFFTKTPLEYRDVANVYFTEYVTDGINPYRINPDPIKQMIYVYSPLNSLIAAGVCTIFNIQAYTAHYVLDMLYSIGIAVVIALYVFRITKKHSAMLISLLFATVLSYRLGYISAIPDHLGLLLSILLLMLVDLTQEFSIKRLLLIGALTVLLFYAKQYFAFYVIPIAIYIGIRTKIKKALIYLAICAVIGLASLYIVNYFCPLFAIYTIYFLFNEVSEKVVSVSPYFYSIKQMKDILICFLVQFALVFADIIYMAKNKKWRKPTVWDVCFVISIPLLFIIGTNDGAYLSYHLQLMCPSLIIVAAIGMSDIAEKYGNAIIIGGLALSIVGYGITTYRLGAPVPYEKREINAWESMTNAVASIPDDESILIITPAAGYYVFNDERVTLDDNGHNYIDGLINKTPYDSAIGTVLYKLGLMNEFGKLAEIAQEREYEYIDRIRNKEYEYVIALDKNNPAQEFYKLITQVGYETQDVECLRTGIQTWDIALLHLSE